jgi:uncharacterized protein with PIN domain
MQKRDDLRFLVDRTAGRLARWLRILGLDVEYADTCDAATISKLVRQSGRIPITRSGDLAARLGQDAILVRSGHLNEQLSQVVGEIGPGRCKPFSRCNVCNAELAGEEKEKVKGRVPEYVYMNHDEFAVCPVCGRYYWQGTHWDSMVKEIARLVEVRHDREGNRRK